MARYRVLARSYIGRLVETGDIVDWDGVAGANLEKLGAPRRGRRPPDAGSTKRISDSDPKASGDQGES